MLKRLICATSPRRSRCCARRPLPAPPTIRNGRSPSWSVFRPAVPSDILARIMADKLGSVLGKPFVVDNRPGAGGNVAGEVVAHAAADGYTLLLGNARAWR